MPAPRLLVIGSLNMDLVVRVARFPRPGETVSAGDLECIPGGKGANQAVQAARLEARVAMVGAVGADAFGKALLSSLRRDRVDTRRVRRLAGIPTGVALITLDPNGENQIVVSPGANGRVRISPPQFDELAGMARRPHLLLLQNEIPFASVQAAVRLARKIGSRSIYNPAPMLPVPRPRLKEVLKQVSVLILNEIEAGDILNARIPSLERAQWAVRSLAEMTGGGQAVLTLGKRGALIAARGEVRRQPAFRVPVVDTTAAGDSFAGAFAVRLVETGDPFAAARFAAAASALAVGRLGAQASLPRRTEVERFLKVVSSTF